MTPNALHYLPAGLFGIVILIFCLVLVVLAILMPVFVLRIRNEMILLNERSAIQHGRLMRQLAEMTAAIAKKDHKNQ